VNFTVGISNENPLSSSLLDEFSSPYVMSLSMDSGVYRSRVGSSVSISGDGSTVAVGAKDALNENSVATGAVYLYSMNSTPTTTSATLLQELFGSESDDDEFGVAIALSRDGRRLVVGAGSESSYTVNGPVISLHLSTTNNTTATEDDGEHFSDNPHKSESHPGYPNMSSWLV
jgi:hypothetical protein